MSDSEVIQPSDRFSATLDHSVFGADNLQPIAGYSRLTVGEILLDAV